MSNNFFESLKDRLVEIDPNFGHSADDMNRQNILTIYESQNIKESITMHDARIKYLTSLKSKGTDSFNTLREKGNGFEHIMAITNDNRGNVEITRAGRTLADMNRANALTFFEINNITESINLHLERLRCLKIIQKFETFNDYNAFKSCNNSR